MGASSDPTPAVPTSMRLAQPICLAERHRHGAGLGAFVIKCW